MRTLCIVKKHSLKLMAKFALNKRISFLIYSKNMSVLTLAVPFRQIAVQPYNIMASKLLSYDITLYVRVKAL